LSFGELTSAKQFAIKKEFTTEGMSRGWYQDKKEFSMA
jgi:hypothetical protein